MAINPIPEGYRTITPYLVVEGASKCIDFLKNAFNAKENHRFAQPDGKITHAELTIGDSVVMIADAKNHMKPVSGNFYLYVEDTDATYNQALQAGATSTMKPADQFYGDRNAGVQDPFGNQWWIGTHIEDVSPEEMRKRAEAFYKNKS